MTQELPGVNVHMHEGRVTGTFELPPAEMQQVSYGGRVVLVLVADVSRLVVLDTKDGETKASWTMKAVDAGIVRDESMKDHLAKVLYLDGLDSPEPRFEEGPPTGTTLVGHWDEEGAFLGLEVQDPQDDGDEPVDNFDPGPQYTPEVVRTPTGVGTRDPHLARFLEEPV